MNTKAKVFLSAGIILLFAALAARVFLSRQEVKQTAAAQEEDFYPFEQPPQAAAPSYELNENSPLALGEIEYDGGTKTAARAMVRPVFNDETQQEPPVILQPAPRDVEGEEAAAFLQKYLSDPKVKEYSRQMQTAMGAVNPSDILKPGFEEDYLKNPQIQKILLEYSKDPAFMSLMQEMMLEMSSSPAPARVRAQGR
ncbi:MAG: hypothetical protein LBR90_00070 [Elusimicrobiota bacterium]|jgi:hypothetical protein|nr:hypothetical protein [Elusimicrobiota bacterium]